jgi:hypothetical protein
MGLVELDATAAARLATLEAEVARLREELEEQPRVYSAQLTDLGDPRYTLECPLLVTVEAYAEEVVASIPEFDLYASGISDAVALANLKAELVSTYERLLELGPDKLGPMLSRWLVAMKKIIKKSNG